MQDVIGFIDFIRFPRNKNKNVMWLGMSKDIESRCLDRVINIMKNMLECDNCIEIYIDYNPLRYPYVSLLTVLTRCNNTNIEGCEDQLYNVVIELTITIDFINKSLMDLDKDIINLRVRCNEGWLEYGYTIPKTKGVPYVAKGFTVSHHGKKLSLESVDQNVIDVLNKVSNLIITKAKHIMEQEGVI